jgi:hypothetical protein
LTGNRIANEYSPMSKKGDKPAKSIYEKLKKDLGISRAFLKNYVLPDWWDDEILETGSGRQEFQLYLSAHLGIPTESWKGNGKLSFRDLSKVNFKKLSNQDPRKFQVSIQIAKSIARKVLNSTDKKQLIPKSANEVRSKLRSINPIKLELTLEYFRSIGIPIIPIWGLSSVFTKPTAMVFKVGEKYAIALGRKTGSSCMQAFNLFHELGHIVSGHLLDSDTAYVDVSIDKDTEDEKETEANRFAVEVFTGTPNFETHLYKGKSGREFAKICKEESLKCQVDPAFLAVNLAWANPKEKKTLWPLSNTALKYLESEHSFDLILGNFFQDFLEDETPEDYLEFLEKITRV